MKSLSETTIEERQAILLLFAKELIFNSRNNVSVLKNILLEEGKKLPPLPEKKEPQKTEAPAKEKNQIEESKEPMIKSVLSNAPPPKEEPPQHEISVMKPIHINPQRKEVSGNMPRPNLMALNIPEPKLPPEFQYLRPTPIRTEIDLGKLNPLINDLAVQTLECEGADKPVIVTGMMGRKPSNVVLSNGEIEEIIQKMSRASKIPADTGTYRVVVGHLIFSAVISDVVPTRFVIKKMRVPQNFIQPIGQKAPNPNIGLYFRK